MPEAVVTIDAPPGAFYEVPIEPIQETTTVELSAYEKLMTLARTEGDLTHALSENDLTELGARVVEDYTGDKEERKDWEDIVIDALKRASQETKCDERTYPWTEASNVQYPLITVGALQFAARAYPAIVKGDEAANCKVVGKDEGRPSQLAEALKAFMAAPGPQTLSALAQVAPELAQIVQQTPPDQLQSLPPPPPELMWDVPPGAKSKRAQRVAEYINATIFYRMDDWESDTDALLHQLPVVGCAFRKLWCDMESGKQCAALVPALRLIAPMGAKSCKTSPRLTEEIPDVYPVAILEKMRAKFYRAVDLGGFGEDDDKAFDISEDKPRLLLEQQRLIDLDEDGMPEPYIVTVDHETRKVLRVEANFGPDSIILDGERVMRIERGKFYVKYDFFPHPEGKFYGIGLGHLLKQMGGVIDAAINTMIDAATAAVAGGGFVASGVRLTGSRRSSNLRFEPGEYKTVEVTGNQLREAIVERTFPQPSPIMFQILEMMLGAARDISSVKDVITGDASNNGQVGTTLALIEQGLQVFTAIYKRIYRSLKEEFTLLFDNLGKYGGEKAIEDYRTILDDPGADFAADFNSTDMDIRPVSDPSSVTKMQKAARAQAIMSMLPMIKEEGGSGREVVMRALAALDVEDVDKIFPPAPPPDPMAAEAIQAKLGVDKARAARDLAAAGKAQAEGEGQKLENNIAAYQAGVALGFEAQS